MRAAIIGGGLAGLTAAYELARVGIEIELFEEASRPGGQIHSHREAGFVVEDGAEGWVAADPDVPALCRELGIEGEIVAQAERVSLALSNGSLAALSAGDAARMLGIQASEGDLGRGIVSLRGGMGTLVESLVNTIKPQVALHLNSAVARVIPKQNRLELDGDGHGAFDAVILATTPGAAAALLQARWPLAARLRELSLASNVSVSLGYPRGAVKHPLQASGFVVTGEQENSGLRACAFSSSKLPNRAPPDHVLLRAFFRPSDTDVLTDDQSWTERATRSLAEALGISGAPVLARVARWPHALPQYSAAYRETVSALDAVLKEANITLAGTGFHPSGVPGAVRSGQAAAKRILESRK